MLNIKAYFQVVKQILHGNQYFRGYERGKLQKLGWLGTLADKMSAVVGGLKIECETIWNWNGTKRNQKKVAQKDWWHAK